MSEWWTYRPSDFLMFSARSYGRLVETYNRDVWPLQLLMLGIGLALTWLAMRRPSAARRAPNPCIPLALVWLWVGWSFHWQRFAQINTAAPYFAWAFVAQAALLAGLSRADEPAHSSSPTTRFVGAGLCMAAVLVYPMLAPSMGRPWAESEFFGLMPEPTALATVGVLVAVRQRHRVILAAIPCLSLLIGGTTAWLMWKT